MSETLRESMSAAIDGEADEFEVRRVLDEIEHDDELREKWHRYHLLGAAMRGESLADARTRTELQSWMSGADVDSDETEPVEAELESPTTESSGWGGWLIRGGIAAAVAVSLVLGVQLYESEPSGPLVADAAPPAGLRLPSEIDRRRANAYMLQHAQHTSIATRTASVPFVKVLTVRAEERSQ